MTAHDTSAYDLVVLGAGTGGYAAALRARQLGLSVALIEADLLGGTCLHRGCIPTKALLHAGHVADQVRNAESFGLKAELLDVDATALHEHKDRVVDRLYRGLRSLITGQQIEVITGHGVLVSADTVRVGDREVTGRNLVLATGSRPKLIDGIEPSERILTSDGALTLPYVPRRAVVIGGGVIGVEFASLWRSLGAEVTVVEGMQRLLPGEEQILGTTLAKALRRRGITVHTDAPISDISEYGDGVSVTLSDDTTVDGDVVLVSVGREPVTADLGFEQAGVRLEKGFVVVDDRLRSSDSIYAVGDLVAGPQLAHRGFAHGVFVAEDIAGLDPAPVRDEHIPRVTYSDPEVAAVGLSEEQATERFGDAVQTSTYDLAGNGRTQIQGGHGLVKLIRTADGPIVGAHLIGTGVGELIGEAQLMVGWEAYPEDVAPLLHAHPTQNESLGEAALALAGKPLHSHH